MLFYPIYTLNYAPYQGFYTGAPNVFNSAFNNNAYVVAEQALNLTVYSLKPNTIHSLFIDGVDVTNRAKQVGRLLGDGLFSNVFGQIFFKYYFGSDLQTTTTVEQAAAIAGLLAGTKQLTIRSADESSSVVIPINIPDYARTQAAVSFKKIAEQSGQNTLTVITTPSGNSSDVYYTPSTYSFIQTFYVDPDAVGKSTEVSLTSIDLFFRTKPSANLNSSGSTQPGVTIAICDVENDSPVISKTYVNSITRQPFDSIFTFTDASTPVTFGFNVPLKLPTGKTYGVVVILEDSHYTLWTNVTGNSLIGTNTKSPGSNVVKDGNLFARNTSGIFTARTNEDLKFNIKAARYNGSNNTITYVNDNYEFLTMANSISTFIAGEQVYNLKPSNDAGTVSITTGSDEVVGVGTSFTTFASDASIAIIANSSLSQVFRIREVANNTVLYVDSPSPMTVSGGNYQQTVSGSVYYKSLADNKLILMGSNANTMVFTAGHTLVGEDSNTRSVISSIDNYTLDRIKLKATTKDSTEGNINSSISVSSVVGNTVIFDTTTQNITLNDVVSTPLRKSSAVIPSRSLEVNNSNLYSDDDLSVVNKSLKVQLDITGSPWRSPAIPDRQIHCYAVSHITGVSTLVGSIDQEIFNNDLKIGRHIEKKITFASERFTEDVRIYMRAYRPLGTDVKVYTRLHNSQDPEAFDDKSWTPLEYKTGSANYSSSSDRTNIYEYELGLPQYSEASSQLTGTFTTTLNSAVLNANGVDPTSSLISGDLVRVYSELFPTNHWIGVVASVNSTTITLRNPITTTNVVGSGFKVEKLKYKNIAFNNINNDNISRYYNSSMAEFDTYDSMQVKIVFTSQTSNLVPFVDSIQVIGVSA